MSEYVGPLNGSLTKNYAGTLPNNPAYILATQNVIRSGTVDMTGLDCLNIIGGFVVTIKTSNLLTNKSFYFFATGGTASQLKLDNGGTISGQSTYKLNPGTVLLVSFNGTNLS
jgi:hypothetical protein